MTQMYLGWHFCAIRNGKPVLRDGTPLEIGRTYEHKGPLVMCESGYHSSEKIVEALHYAPGAYLCRTLSSNDETDTDKHVSRYRIALAGFDATNTLHEFAVRIAYCALLKERECGREPDARSWNALRVKQAWLRGEATDADLAAARDAARAAARDAAWAFSNDMLLSILPPELVDPSRVGQPVEVVGR